MTPSEKMPTANNVLIMQSGGCTPVINRSLAGLVKEAIASRTFGELYGAEYGLEGLLGEHLLDLRRQSAATWRRIESTPGAALGSGRRRLKSGEVSAAQEVLEKYGIGYVFMIGGNDSAETAHLLASQAHETGSDLAVVHVPKTIDNDLPVTDHTPGYGSATRFVALATMGAGKDAEAMGEASPLTVLEVMGRDAGWLAASSALGKRDEMDAPHFICTPEVPLDEDHFLSCMEEAYRRWGYAVVVTAENAKSPSGPLGVQVPFYIDAFGHKYYEGPGRYLARLAGRKLRVRARFEKPGTIQRSMMSCLSSSDSREPSLVGRMAVRYALEGHTDCMVTLVRGNTAEYDCDTGLVSLEAVAGKVRALPNEYIDATGAMVTQAYLDYARPLVGRPLPRHARLVHTSPGD